MIHISTMSGKLEGLRAINTNTLTNTFCVKMNKTDSICGKCYSHTMLKSYRKNCVPKFEQNSKQLSETVLNYDELPIIKDKYFRFSAHGELINATHLGNLVNIASANPHCTFALWSKRKDIVRLYFDKHFKPDNLILIYSNPKIGAILDGPPKHFAKTFNNVLETDNVERQNCTGQKCADCLLCYQHDTTNTIVEKVKRY